MAGGESDDLSPPAADGAGSLEGLEERDWGMGCSGRLARGRLRSDVLECCPARGDDHSCVMTSPNEGTYVLPAVAGASTVKELLRTRFTCLSRVAR